MRIFMSANVLMLFMASLPGGADGEPNADKAKWEAALKQDTARAYDEFLLSGCDETRGVFVPCTSPFAKEAVRRGMSRAIATHDMEEAEKIVSQYARRALCGDARSNCSEAVGAWKRIRANKDYKDYKAQQARLAAGMAAHSAVTDTATRPSFKFLGSEEYCRSEAKRENNCDNAYDALNRPIDTRQCLAENAARLQWCVKHHGWPAVGESAFYRSEEYQAVVNQKRASVEAGRDQIARCQQRCQSVGTTCNHLSNSLQSANDCLEAERRCKAKCEKCGCEVVNFVPQAGEY